MTTSLRTLLLDGAKQIGIAMTDHQCDQLLAYVALLDKWNKAYNLTSVRDPREMVVKHILDSIVICPAFAGVRCVADVGTGPGLPGVPLAIMMPEIQFVLLDTLGKRVRFLKQVKHELSLTNIEPVQARVEQYHTNQLIDVVISRAFASIGDMLNWCAHLGNRFFAMKGVYPEQELADITDPFAVAQISRLSVPGLEGERHLVEIIKSQ